MSALQWEHGHSGQPSAMALNLHQQSEASTLQLFLLKAANDARTATLDSPIDSPIDSPMMHVCIHEWIHGMPEFSA